MFKRGLSDGEDEHMRVSMPIAKTCSEMLGEDTTVVKYLMDDVWVIKCQKLDWMFITSEQLLKYIADEMDTD